MVDGMPIYEYICKKCRKRAALFVRGMTREQSPVCEQCGSPEMVRIMSRFSAPKSDESRLESLADPSRWGGVDDKDPKSIANFVRKMGSEMGEEVSRDEIDQMADEAAREAGGDIEPGEPNL
jgi:putative FmdB family regulatory protein